MSPVDLNIPLVSYSDIPADVMTPLDPRLFAAGAVLGAVNRASLCRVVAKKSGFLRDMTVGVSVASGNIDVGVYDTGDTTTTVRTLIGHSGSLACPTAVAGGQLVVTWDPGAGVIPIVAGRQYDFALSADNNTAAFYRVTNATTFLPSGSWAVPGAALPKLSAIVSTAFPLLSTIAEGLVSQGGVTTLIMGRVSPT